MSVLLVLSLWVGVSAAQAQKSRKNDVISAEEIAKVSGSTAYDAVKTLRPQWLRVRGISSGMPDVTQAGIVVYVDGMRQGGVEALEDIGVERVQEIRFLSATDATTKYGTGHTQGAIEVIQKH